MDASTTAELQSLLQENDYDFRFNCGYSKPTPRIDISEKEELIRVVWLHYIFFLPHAELEQLRKGLRETLQVDVLCCLHPENVWSLLAASSAFEVTAKFFLESFIINYSDQGSNKRTLEEALVLHWTDFIQECEGEHLTHYDG